MKFEAEVTALSEQGMGVVKGPDGKTYFIRGAWPQDQGVFRITEPASEKSRYGFGEVETLLRPSPERVVPACPHLGIGDHDCGGCPWMIADYSHQLRYKAHRVRHAFERVSLDTATVMDPWSSPRVLGYRARSQFKTDGKQIGYAGRMGRSIAPITQCLVLNERMSAQFSSLKESLPNPAWTPGDNFAFTFIDVNEETDLASAAVQINKRQAFKQANNLQNVRMKEWLETGLADHPRQRAVVELFCGSGNLTQTVVSLGFNQVAAMDIQSVALDELAARQLSGVTVTALDLYGPSVSNRITRAFPDTAILLVNPPRYGLKELVRLAAILNKLETIFYISCNPVTCAFDLKKILGLSKGWRISGIQPIDMMPHTPHIEILGRLDRR